MRDPVANGEDETVVDEQQGNGMLNRHSSSSSGLRAFPLQPADQNGLSPDTYHIATETRSGPQSRNFTNIHPRTAVDAGKNNKVRRTILTRICRTAILTVGGSFMAHPETLLPMPTIDDPIQRFISVVKFYLSGWHIRPPYVCLRTQRVLSLVNYVKLDTY